MIRVIAFAVLMTTFTTPALGASGNAASATGDVSATIVSPILLRELADLDFGTITSSRGAPGSVTIGPEGNVSYSGGTGAACLGGGSCASPHPSRFAVTGEPNRSYIVTTPASVRAQGSALDGSDAALPDLIIESISVRTHNRPESASSGKLDGNGNDTFNVGGTLRVPAGSAAGHYRATLPLVVTYG